MCDAPARVKIKNTVLHNVYFGCAKCFVKGVYFIADTARGGRVTFTDLDEAISTKENFRNREQSAHHKECQSVIEELDLDMTLDFPDDEMHLIELGCVRKILFFLNAEKTRLRGYKRGN